MNAKKILSLLLALALVLGLLSGCGAKTGETVPAEAEPTAEAAAEPTQEPAEPTAEPVDYDALYRETLSRLDRAWRSHDTDELVCTVNGEPVNWGLYFYLLCDELQSYISYTATLPEDYSQQLTEDMTMEQYFKEMALSKTRYYTLAHVKAEELGVAAGEEQETELQEYWEQMAEDYGGEEALLAAMEESQLTRDVFFYMVRSSNELAALMEELYGVDGAKLDEEDVYAWAQEDEYIRTKHVLYFFYDDAGQPMDEDGKAAQLAKAEAALAELRALAGDPEALEERFDEIMNADTGDAGGLSRFPEGYTFTPGTMYTEFEDAAFALEEYGLSEIVESQSGYHIILRLPLDADGLTMDQDANTGDYMTLRQSAANDKFARDMAGWMKDAEVVWADGFEDLDLAELFAREE